MIETTAAGCLAMPTESRTLGGRPEATLGLSLGCDAPWICGPWQLRGRQQRRSPQFGCLSILLRCDGRSFFCAQHAGMSSGPVQRYVSIRWRASGASGRPLVLDFHSCPRLFAGARSPAGLASPDGEALVCRLGILKRKRGSRVFGIEHAPFSKLTPDVFC